MLALHQKEYGDLSTFTIGTLPIPTPTADQVLICVHAAALNPVDLLRSSVPIPDETFPVVTGYDVAGIVKSVGASVTSFKPGDRVFGNIQKEAVGPKTSGSVAQYCVSDPELLALIPEGSSYVDAAALPLAATSAIQAFEMTEVKKGENVFVSAGAGGVGIHAIQIARNMFGAAEVATTASAAKADFVRMYGADHVVDYKTEDAGEVLKGWADVVLDSTQEIDMEKRVMKEGGRLVSIKAFGRDDVKSFMLEENKGLMEKTAKLLRDGKLRPVIDSVYSLEEAVKAVEHLAGGRAMGKVVVKIRDD